MFISLDACTVGQRATYSVGTCQAGTSAALAVSPEMLCNTHQYKTAVIFAIKIVFFTCAFRYVQFFVLALACSSFSYFQFFSIFVNNTWRQKLSPTPPTPASCPSGVKYMVNATRPSLFLLLFQTQIIWGICECMQESLTESKVLHM